MISLPWPPTVNHYYTVSKGRKILSKRGREYKRYCCELMMVQGVKRLKSRSYSVFIKARPPDKRKRDLDNLLKPILDSLTVYGAITDDSKVDDLRIQRFNPTPDGAVEIIISGANE